MSKLTIVLVTAVEAKSDLVLQYGIGEDLSQVLYGWKGPDLVVICRMTDRLRKKSNMVRLRKCGDAVAVMRQGWGVDALSMVAEGYVSDSPSDTDGVDFVREFANGNKTIKECITVTHVAGDEISFVSKSYVVSVPRQVVWDEEVFTPGTTLVRGPPRMYPLLFSKALELDIVGFDEEKMGSEQKAFYAVLVDGLKDIGFDAHSMV